MPITSESATVVLKSGRKTVSISNERMVMNTFIKNTCLKHQRLQTLIFINTLGLENTNGGHYEQAAITSDGNSGGITGNTLEKVHL